MAKKREDRPSRPRASRRNFVILAFVCLTAVCAGYANHFHNSFHFDDSHTIVNNPYIRDLHNIPKFFTDGRTFSTLPANQSWRPLVSTSLAIDYWVAGGLNPLWFHISTFFWFLIQLVLIFWLYESVLNQAVPSPANPYLALFTTTWYGLHPVSAETVNYIIQRGDLYSTVGVVAGLLLYIRLPKLRRFGLYLIPVALGAMAKPPAVMFCAILLVYVVLFEEEARPANAWRALRKSLPAVVVCGTMAILNVKLTPKSFVPAVLSHSAYWATQPFVALKYIRSFFLPLWLSADTDMRPFDGFANGRAVIGIVRCLVILAIAAGTARQKKWRPVSFGLIWFFLALAPTSLVVLSEVENDHRMFFPFVGLALSVTWAGYLLLVQPLLQPSNDELRGRKTCFAIGATAAMLLCAYGFGTWQRNRVWRSEESLWRDVTVKSPQNGRGLMNYGLTKMEKGDAVGALDYFNRAVVLNPDYYFLETNLAIAHGMLGHGQEAELHFRRAISLSSNDVQPYFYYGRWLKSQGRVADSIQAETYVIERNPAYVDARYLLMQTYAEQRQWSALKQLAEQTLQLLPNDAAASRYLALAESGPNELARMEQQVKANPTPEGYLSLSLYYHQAGRYQDCIDAAHKALQLRPDYAEAYNNIAAGYQSMHRWDEAIAAAREAVRLKPDFQLARNNLADAIAQKRMGER